MNRQKRIFGQQEIVSKPDLEFVVSESCGLLDFLLLKLSNKSRNHVKSLLTHREVLVNGTVITQYDAVLHKGQKIQIKRSIIEGKKQKSVLDILYEDSDIIVINKPAGLLSIASDKEKELTAYHLLTDYVRMKDPRNRIFAVHRLDRDTSGVLMVAKNEKMKLALQDSWADLVSERGYVAVVEGQLKEKCGRIQSWLKETRTFLVYSSSRAGDGLEAITDYQVLNETTEYSLLNINLETGRKNQIRVHMKDIGHNVVGDKKYGAKTDPLKRLGLHAYKLEFKHPFSDKVMCFQTQSPRSFTSLFVKSGPNNMQNG
ncbi:RluA family pseudouridine synthase [Clostridium sp. KNHs216]|uniref:RluA family pseudouridine synthase n=1 Tax=Clostridium sp. KNHs216 TaxID=1550235 RepID=UPI00116ED3E3|nr:RluA family pseudouridine synthase [Clostridium sp. KNHs216]TQI66294.1 23S rRNA pseudouridine1911/1915/1917 synthase [Clostridium sp. KNHs216]